MDYAPCQKWAKCEGFVAVSKNDGRRGTFEEDLERCISRCRRTTRDTWVSCVRRSGRRFPERGCILEHEIFRFAKMILCDRCSTSYDLASLFRGRRSSLDRWSGKIAKRIGTRPSALHSTFHFWRTSRRIASFLMLSTLKRYNYTNYLHYKLQLHYTTTLTTTALHHTTSSSCRWGDHCNHCNHSNKQLQPPFGPSVDYRFALPSVIHNNQPLL